jgi:hypothetical protein
MMEPYSNVFISMMTLEHNFVLLFEMGQVESCRWEKVAREESKRKRERERERERACTCRRWRD